MEKLGGIRTTYQIVSEGFEANVVEQYLVKRANYATEWDQDGGAGYGYKALYLEFSTIGSFISIEEADYKKGDGALRMRFNDKEGDLLYQHLIHYRGSFEDNKSDKLAMERCHKQGVGKYFYIELTGVPYLVLNKTVSIDFRELVGTDGD